MGISTRELHYIGGGDGLAAVYIKTNGTGTMFYILKDHLGSIQYIRSEDGLTTEESSFDAWGRRRNPADYTDFNVAPSNYLNRGFTGHEHLNAFGLIDMNGRVYDPTLGRFLSPDPYVQMPGFTQSFNRYSYCLNNPLIFTDPSGNFAWAYYLAQLAGNYLFNLADNTINKKMPMNQALHQFNFNMNYSPNNNRFFTPGVDAQMAAWNMETSQVPAYTMTGSWRQLNAYAGGYDDLAYQYSTWKYVSPSGQGDGSLYWNAKVGAIPESDPFYSSQFTLHYIFGDGSPIHLSDNGFSNIYNTAVKNKAIEWNSINSLGNNRYSVTANFYNTTFDLKNAFGRATFYLQYDKGQFSPTGFYDYWDLDSKASGVRPGSAESTTHFFNSILNGTPFKITYP